MNKNVIQDSSLSKVDEIASSGNFNIELINRLGINDYKPLIEISHSLAEEYGKKYILNDNTIEKYFNREGSLPIIARLKKTIVGYIIGMPLELLSQEPWSRLDENYGKFNTLYTYAFVIEKKYKKNGYAKILKKVYLNWAKKRKGIFFSTGHVKKGISSKFKGKIEIINQIENWQGTGRVFEYYRRNLDPEKIHQKKLVNSNV